MNKILLVEDDDDINELVAELLVEEGYNCIQVYDGITATQLLKKEKFDILITDFKMPFMDGLQLVEWCREQNIFLAVIFISANSNLIPESVVALSGFSAKVIKKPMEIDELLNAVTSMTSDRKSI